LATTIEGYIFTFATAINGMFMPRVSEIVHDGKKETEILPLMSKIGRIQCLIIGALVVGFIVFGQSFVIDIWNKPNFSDSYLCAVLLIIPSFFYLPMQIAHTTMIVENKVKIRAYVYIGIGVLNVVLSLFLSKYFGALGASLSIFIAYMVRVILMAIIYKKVLKINMKVFFKKTFFKIAPLLLLCLVVGFLLESFNPLVNKYLRFGANGLVFIAFFVLLAKLIFMNSYEKNLFFGTVKKAFQKITSRRVNR
jgi:O-antigen/teichoic acid export membrane protein